MATHPHHCHCLPTPPTQPTPPPTTCYCTICYTTTPYPLPPQPQLPLTHPISPHHHHQHHHNPPPQTHPQYYPFTPPPQPHPTHPTHHLYQQNNQYPPPPPPQTHHQNYPFTPPPQTPPPPPPSDPTVTTLINRISALETTLRRRNKSLRHAAARTIQTHFRAYLVRRSITLRHLKNLAHIKSLFNHLKSSVSNKTHFDPLTLSQELISLLIKLDSIQGGDPMIRDGKRSISREVVRFMEEIDEMCVESEVIAIKKVVFGKNSKKSVVSGSGVFGFNEKKFLEKIKNQRKIISQVGESEIRIGDLKKSQSQSKSQLKVKKNVRFDEDGNVYRLIKSKHDSVSSDRSDEGCGDDVEVEVEEIGVSSKETEVEEEDSSEMSENEMDPRKNLRSRIDDLTKKIQASQDDDEGEEDEEDDSFVFSAPLPAKMEY